MSEMQRNANRRILDAGKSFDGNAAGTAARFEPGQTRTVTLVEISGAKTIYGFRRKVMGKL